MKIPLLPKDDVIKAMTREDAEAVWRNLRWPNGKPRCPACQGTDVFKLGTRNAWRCKADRSEFSPMSGTTFASSKLPIVTVLRVVSAAQHHNGEKSLRRISKETGIGYKTFYTLFCKAQELLICGIDQKSSLVGYMSGNTYGPKDAPRAKIGRITDQKPNDTTGPIIENKPIKTLLAPRFIEGRPWATGTLWTTQDKCDLTALVSAKASIEAAVVSLGRSAKSIAWCARDLLPHGEIPKAWKDLIQAPRLILPVQPKLLFYPYLPRMSKRAAVSGAQMTMDVSALVSRAYPDFMRADISQLILLAILEGRVTLNDLRDSADAVRAFVRSYRRDQDTLPGVGGGMRNGRSSLDAPRWGDDDRDAHEMAIPSGVMNRLEW